MNKPLLILIRMLLFASAMAMATTGVRADELIFLENSFETYQDHPQLNPDDQQGTVSWTADTKTLLLKDVRITTSATLLTGWMSEEITIRVEGSNYIECTNMSDAIKMRSAIRFTGTGTLSIITQGNAAIACDGGGITIADGVSIVAAGAAGGIYGDWRSPLIIDNAYVAASTLPDSPIAQASIGYFSKIELRGCEIVSPDGARVERVHDAASVTTDGETECFKPVLIAPKKGYAKVTIAEDPNGTIMAPEGMDLSKVLIGTPIGFSAVPKQGYALTKLMAGSEDITTTQILVVKGDVTVTPTFTSGKSHRVTLHKPEHGSLSVQETTCNLEAVADGTILHFICTPNEGYELESLMAGKEDIIEAKYLKVSADVEVTATYKLIPVPTYKVKIVTLGHGKVTADYPDLDAVPDGTTVHLTCTPETNNDELIALTANGENILESKSFVIESRDTRVEAEFKRTIHPAVDHPESDDTYQISLSGDQLTITGLAEDTLLSLSSLLGETMIQTTATSVAQIDLSTIPSGVYLLTIGHAVYKLYL